MLEGEGEGLAERWEEWQKEEVIRQDVNTIHHPSTWIIDSPSPNFLLYYFCEFEEMDKNNDM